MRRTFVVSIVAPFLLLAACGDSTVQAIGGGPTASIPDGGILLPDGAIVFPTDGSLGGSDAPTDAPSFCQGGGASIPLANGAECTGDLGSRLFRFAMCACTGAAVSGKLTTDSFDSASPADGGTSGKTASIAANGSVATNSHTSIGGYVYAGGASLAVGQPAVQLDADGTIARDVRSGGDVTVPGAYTIEGDLYSAGNVSLSGTGSLTVVGKTHLAPGKTATGVTESGGNVTEAVSVVPPCDCAAPLDIPSLVAPFQSANDDAMAGVTPTSLDHPAAPVTLPCGRYYFDAIQGGDVTINLTGRTAIFVGGDVTMQGALTVNLSPGAEVDLFVAGGFSEIGNASLGSVTSPSKVRVYIGGTTLTLSGNASVGANLYAPHADVQFSSTFEMSGAIYARSLAFSGDFTIHYDEAVTTIVGCEAPGGSCTTCNDCGGSTPACKGSVCAPCTTNADCCAPEACNTQNGKCVEEIK